MMFAVRSDKVLRFLILVVVILAVSFDLPGPIAR